MVVTHQIKVLSENSQKAKAPPSRCSRRKAVLAHKATLVTRVIHHQLLLGPTLARQARKRQQKEREEKKLRAAARKRKVNPANEKFSPSAQQTEPNTDDVTPTRTLSYKDETTSTRTTKVEPAPDLPAITSTPKVPPRKMSAMAPSMGRSLPEAPCLKHATVRHKLPPPTPTSSSVSKPSKTEHMREEVVVSTEQARMCKKQTSPAKPVLSKGSLPGSSSTSGGITHAEISSSRRPKTRKNAKSNRSRPRDDNEEERGSSIRRKKRRTHTPQTSEEREREVIDITESPPPDSYEGYLYSRAVASPYEGPVQASPLRSVWVDNSALMDLLMGQHAAGTNRQRRHWILEILVGATDAATILAALAMLNSLYDPALEHDPVVDRVVDEAKLLSCRSVQGIVADTLTQLNRGRDGLLSTMESMSWGSIIGRFVADRLGGNELVESEHLLALGLSSEQAANIMPTVRLLEGRTHLEYMRLEQQLSFVQREVAAAPGLSLQLGPPLSQLPLYLF